VNLALKLAVDCWQWQWQGRGFAFADAWHACARV
jgi:hypothetical protein